MKKKICHLIFSFNSGGAENMLVDIINEQIEHSAIDLIIVNDSFDNNLLSEINPVINIIKINRKRGSIAVLAVLKLNLLLFRKNYDIIHCHNHKLIGIIYSKFRNKAVLTIHTTKTESKYFHQYSKIFAISTSVGNDIKKRYNLNPIVIYNGIKINKVRQREEPFNFRKKLKMLQIGRLKHKVKGQDLAIKAIKGLSRKYNLSLDFIGDGQSKSYLMDLVNEYNLSSIINFLGLKKKGWIYDNIYHYDLLIMPSINEGFGLTVVEGIAAKIPVLVSNIEGPMEIINNGEFGFYFESNNVEDLKSKIVEIIKTDIDFISSQTDNAYDYCKSNFDVKVTAMNYLNNY